MQLKVFDLHKNLFSAEQTEILLKTITEAEMFNSLTTLDLFMSTNFTFDESIRYLAMILAKA